MNDKEEFLKELSELSKKYKLYIGGCGCCSSPFVYNEAGNDVLSHIGYNHIFHEYEEE